MSTINTSSPLLTAALVARAGTFAEGEGNAYCTACEAGSAREPSSTFPNSTCARCPVSEYSLAGQAKCGPCDGGEEPAEGGVACEPCQIGRASDSTGNSTCTACAQGRFALEPGASECRQCLGDTYLDPSQECSVCPKGADCSGAAFFETLPASPGYYAHHPGGNATPSFYACPGGVEACPGGKAAAGSSALVPACNEDMGYTGEGCLQCLDGFYRTGAMACRACSTAVGGTAAVTVLLMLVSVVGLVVIVRSGPEQPKQPLQP